MHLFFGANLSSPCICLASRGERSDHSFINTSLQRGAYGVARQANRFSGFSGALKTPRKLSGLRTLALAFAPR